jgi:hypothetical protein
MFTCVPVSCQQRNVSCKYSSEHLESSAAMSACSEDLNDVNSSVTTTGRLSGNSGRGRL